MAEIKKRREIKFELDEKLGCVFVLFVSDNGEKEEAGKIASLNHEGQVIFHGSLINDVLKRIIKNRGKPTEKKE